jgi:hypothetical protein
VWSAPSGTHSWNIERSKPGDRLYRNVPEIVIHWYGDKETFDRSERAICGFNSVRRAGEAITRTSAHFLVGTDVPTNQSPRLEDKSISIPDPATRRGWLAVPGISAAALDHLGYKQRQQYFVRSVPTQ